MKKVISIILLTIFIFLFTGCGTIQTMLDSETISDDYLETMLQSIIDGDEDAAYAVFVTGAVTKASLHTFFTQVKDYWNGSNTFTYKKTNVSISTTANENIEKQIDCVYAVQAGETDYIISTSRVVLTNGASGLLKFNIVKSEEYAAKIEPTGTLKQLQNLTLLNGVCFFFLL